MPLGRLSFMQFVVVYTSLSPQLAVPCVCVAFVTYTRTPCPAHGVLCHCDSSLSCVSRLLGLPAYACAAHTTILLRTSDQLIIFVLLWPSQLSADRKIRVVESQYSRVAYVGVPINATFLSYFFILDNECCVFKGSFSQMKITIFTLTKEIRE